MSAVMVAEKVIASDDVVADIAKEIDEITVDETSEPKYEPKAWTREGYAD
jgi:hypothetical protein